MKELKDILYKVPLQTVVGSTAVPVAALSFDSRQVEPDGLFFAVRGTQVDGHQYIAQAIDKGAKSIVCEQIPDDTQEGITYVQVENAAQALGIVAANYYDNPSARMKVVAITGTNGKSTVVTLLHQLFMKLGYNIGLLSTVVNKINDTPVAATHTTPDALQLHSLLAKMVQAGCTHCFMEASSHAIVQHRITGLQLAGAVFINITHDHLDYHKTFEEYIKAKKILFDNLPPAAFALVNVDDKRGRIMLQNTRAAKKTFALKSIADFKAQVITNALQGLELEMGGMEKPAKQAWFKLIGDFNAYNLLAAYGVAVLLGEEEEEVLMQLSAVQPATGRFEQIISPEGVVAIVDYAHTPDALKNVLETIQKVRTRNEQVITVVGCGGDRDKTKRPKMAAIAARLSDKVILTSDNPRSEDPEQIIRDMQQGVGAAQSKKVLSITDRREAIRAACMMAGENDIVLVAGKGHETYQEINGVKYDFDDKKVIADVFGKVS